MACTPRALKISSIVCLVLGLVFLVLACIIPPIVYNITDDSVEDRAVVASPHAPEYDDWRTTTDDDDTPIYVEVLFYNVTNDAELRAGTATHIDVEEVGPYTWRRHVRKHNVSFSDDAHLVRYYTQEWHEFAPEHSRDGADPELDTIFTPSLSYVSLVRRVGSEAQLHAVFLPGVLAQVYAGTMATSPLFSGSRTAFARAWGSDGTPGNAQQQFPGAPSGASFYLTYVDHARSTMNARKFAKIAYDAATTEALLWGPTGFLIDGGDAAGGLYWLTVFIDLASRCAPLAFDLATPQCAPIAQLWPMLTANRAAARLRAMLAFAQSQLTTVAAYTWAGAKAANGGTLFAARTPNQLLFTGLARDNVTGAIDDPLLALVGSSGSSLLCDNEERVDDPCALGFSEQLTGAALRHDAGKYTMARSMSVLPALNSTFCDPLSACDEQTPPGGVWAEDVAVDGHSSTMLGVGKAPHSYDWEHGVSADEVVTLWSDTLLRPVRLEFAAYTRVHSVDTLRFTLAQSTVDVDARYFQSEFGLLNRTSLARGAPVFGVPNGLAGLGVDEARALLPPTLRITTLEGCVSGNGTCLIDDERALLDASTYFDVEPKTGFTMSAHERLTTVLEVRRFVDGDYTQLPRGLDKLDGGFYMPIAAIDKWATVSRDDADDLSTNLSYQDTADTLLIVFAVLAGVALIAALLLFVASYELAKDQQ